MTGFDDFETTYFNTDLAAQSMDRLLEAFVTGRSQGPEAERLLMLHDLDFPWRAYNIGLVDTGLDLFEAGKLRGIKCLIESLVNDNFYGYTFLIDGYIGILFRNVSPLALPRILRMLQEKVRDAFGLTAAISLGISVDSLSFLPRSYSHALRLLGHKFLYGHKQIIIKVEEPFIRGEETRESGDENDSADMGWITEDLYCSVYMNNAAAVNNILEDMKNRQVRSRLDENTIRSNYSHLYLSVIDMLEDDCGHLCAHADEKKAVLEEIKTKSSLQELHGYIKFKLLSVSENIGGQKRRECPIGKVLEYIDRNFGRDIRLESISGLFGYNSTYLGKLFKSKTGEYFNTYLDRLRIEKAKLFLKEGLKVYKVAEKVGISDIDYFHKKFKKYAGLSPSAFKGKA